MYYTLYDWNGEFQGRVDVTHGEPNPKWAPFIIKGKHSTFTRLVDGEVVETDTELLTIENATLARRKRNALLQSSDYTQLQDTPESSREAWAEYRRKLRDLPEQEGFPDNITWPEKP